MNKPNWVNIKARVEPSIQSGAVEPSLTYSLHLDLTNFDSSERIGEFLVQLAENLKSSDSMMEVVRLMDEGVTGDWDESTQTMVWREQPSDDAQATQSDWLAELDEEEEEETMGMDDEEFQAWRKNKEVMAGS